VTRRRKQATEEAASTARAESARAAIEQEIAALSPEQAAEQLRALHAQIPDLPAEDKAVAADLARLLSLRAGPGVAPTGPLPPTHAQAPGITPSSTVGVIPGIPQGPPPGPYWAYCNVKQGDAPFVNCWTTPPPLGTPFCGPFPTFAECLAFITSINYDCNRILDCHGAPPPGQPTPTPTPAPTPTPTPVATVPYWCVWKITDPTVQGIFQASSSYQACRQLGVPQRQCFAQGPFDTQIEAEAACFFHAVEPEPTASTCPTCGAGCVAQESRRLIQEAPYGTKPGRQSNPFTDCFDFETSENMDGIFTAGEFLDAWSGDNPLGWADSKIGLDVFTATDVVGGVV
jgi:hypothetical protein